MFGYVGEPCATGAQLVDGRAVELLVPRQRQAFRCATPADRRVDRSQAIATQLQQFEGRQGIQRRQVGDGVVVQPEPGQPGKDLQSVQARDAGMGADQVLQRFGMGDALVGDGLRDALAQCFVRDRVVGEQFGASEQRAFVERVLIAGTAGENGSQQDKYAAGARYDAFQVHEGIFAAADERVQAYYSDGGRVPNGIGSRMKNSSLREPSAVVVVALGDGAVDRAATLAAELGCACVAAGGGEWRALVGEHLALLVDDTGLALAEGGASRRTPVRVDFAAPELLYRLRRVGARNEDLARAIGMPVQQELHVVDATAGWGRDSAVLAALGCRVTLIERHPVIGRLLADGLARAAASPDGRVRALVARMHLLAGDAVDLLRRWSPPAPDVVLLDPMFPERRGSAAARKEMDLFQQLVGKDEDAGVLLAAALATAGHRVVVKRPRRAPSLAGRRPSHVIEGRSVRLDVHVLRAYGTSAAGS